ncbi:MAG: protein kinase [Planctomycetota bacterium]
MGRPWRGGEEPVNDPDPDLRLAAALTQLGLSDAQARAALAAARAAGRGLAEDLLARGLDPALLARARELAAEDAGATLQPPPGTSPGISAATWVEPASSATEVHASPLIAPAHPRSGPSGSGASHGPDPERSGDWRRALSAAPGTELDPTPWLGAFRLERLLGRGGMGAVFRAVQEPIGRRVALKVLLAGEGAAPDQVERFLREARAAGRLNHAHVVPIYEVGLAEGVHFIAMELVEGPSLAGLIEREGALPPRRALSLLEQTARGVAAAHAAGIVHRDLKPHNVLVAPGDVAKVMDFGLARELDEGSHHLTASGALIGTPAYMSPEQANGLPAGTPADVYGLGAVLYEALTGRPPFTAPTRINLIAMVLSQDPEPPRARRPELHSDVETICLKAMEKDPQRRYAGAAQLADDAARWLAGEAIAARPPTRVERLARALRRNRLASIAGAAVLVAVVLVAISVVLIRARIEQRVREAREREAAGLERAADEATAARAAARAECAAIAAQPVTDAAAARASAAAIASRAAVAEVALSGLPAEVRARLGAQRAIDVGALQARVWGGLGDRLAEGDSAAAREAWAWAYQAGPAALPGRLALARLAAVQPGRAGRELIDHYLASLAVDEALVGAVAATPNQEGAPAGAQEGAQDGASRGASPAPSAASPVDATKAASPLDATQAASPLDATQAASPLDATQASSPGDATQAASPGDAFLAASPVERAALRAAAEGLRLRRVRRRLAALEVDAALRDLAQLPAELAAVAPLRRLADALAPRCALPLPELARHVYVDRAPPGAGADRLALLGAAGGCHVLELDGHAPRWTRLATPALGDEQVQRFAVSAARPGRAALVAAYGQRRTLVVQTASGAEVLRRRFLSEHCHALRFVELDGDPATRELVLSLGPNAGDGVLVRFDAAGRLVGEPARLDPRPLGGPRGARFISALATGALEPGAPVAAIARGAWAGNDLELFRCTPEGRLASLGAPVELGFCSGLALSRGELVAAQLENEEPWAKAWTQPGLAVYRLADGRVALPPRLHLPDQALGGPARGWSRGPQRLVLFERGEARYLLGDYLPGSSPEDDERARRFVADLDGADAAAALVLSELRGDPRWSPFGAGDLLGTGAPQLLALERGGLRLLLCGGAGPAADPVEVEPDPAPLDPAEARLRAAPLLSTLGFGRQAMARLLEDEAEHGPSPGGEALGLALLHAAATRDPPVQAVRERWARALWPEDLAGLDVSRAADPALVALAAAFLRRGRSPATRARAHLLLTRALLAASDPQARLRAADELAEVAPALLLPREREEHTLLVRRVSLLTAPALELDLRRALPADLAASDPLRLAWREGQGLRAQVSAKVPLIVGVPVELLPDRALRLEVDLSFRGQSWDAKLEVGLVRDREGAPLPLRSLETLGLGLDLWQAAADLRRQELRFDVGAGLPGRLIMPGLALLRPLGSQTPRPLRLGYPLVLGCRLRAVIEHEPRDHWTRLELRALPDDAPEDEPGALVALVEGHTQTTPSPGRYLLGLYAAGDPRVDPIHGAAFGPSCEVVVRRLSLGSHAGVPVQRGISVAEALVAGGRALRGEDALPAYAAALAVEPDPEERAHLLVQRAALQARAGRADPARADLRSAWAGSPLGCYRALAGAARHLDPPSAQVAAEVLRDLLAELDRELAGASAGDLALTLQGARVRRAALHLLRGDHELAARDLALGGAQAPSPGPEPSCPERRLWVWLWAALGVQQGVRDELQAEANQGRGRALRGPRAASLLAPLWLPTSDADPLALATQSLAQTRDPREQLRWARRLERLTRGAPREQREPALARCLRVALPPWERDALLTEYVALAPDDPQRRSLLGVAYTLSEDYARARAELRRARALGADPEAVLAPYRSALEARPEWPEVRAALTR